MITTRYRNWEISFDERTEKWHACDIYGYGGTMENHSLKSLKQDADAADAAMPEVVTLMDGKYQIAKVQKLLEDGRAIVLCGINRQHLVPKHGYAPATPENIRTMTILNALFAQVETIEAEARRLTTELFKPYSLDTTTTNAQH